MSPNEGRYSERIKESLRWKDVQNQQKMKKLTSMIDKSTVHH
jgi:hypothetical protein